MKPAPSLRILIIGPGRMGVAVKAAAERVGHEVVGIWGRTELAEGHWPTADVAIEFTAPESAVSVMAACRARQMPLVSGTTGWEEHWEKVSDAVASSGHRLLWAPNFSKGVYLFRKALGSVMNDMDGHAEFNVAVHEVHHTGKRDAPSGTAKAVAQDIEARGGAQVPITAQRIAGVPGTHTVTWRSEIDSIELTHSAMSRNGFADGAVAAAEWLVHQPANGHKIFGMDDVWG